MAFAENEMEEYELTNELAARTGCGILLDCNNIFVQAHNHGYDAWKYIDGTDAEKVGEMHLAGHIEQEAGEDIILVDTHSRPVKKDVWDLYEHAVKRLGPVPTLIEWDKDFPPLATLVEEANKARDIMNHVLNRGMADAAE